MSGRKADTTTPTEPKLEARDPLDIGNIRRQRTGLLRTNVKSFAVGVAERAPKTFIYAHPDPAFSIEVAFVPSDPEKDIDAAHVIADTDIADELVMEGRAKEAILTRIVTRQGQHKLWLIKVPVEGEKVHVAHSTALQCLEVVRGQWGWVRWEDLDTGYVVEVPVEGVEMPPPQWGQDDRDPGEVMQEMIRKGFRDHVIADRDHPVYKLVATGGIVA